MNNWWVNPRRYVSLSLTGPPCMARLASIPPKSPNYRPKHLVGHSEMVKIGRETFPDLLAWHGWQAFRQSLATNLHHLGVADKVFRAIVGSFKCRRDPSVLVK